MKIGLIGAGNVTTALGQYWARNGHELLVSFSRDEAKLRAAAQSIHPDVRTGSPAEAATFGEIVVLAVPFTALEEALRQAGPLPGKLVLSCVNALKPDNSGLAVGTTTSAAEEIARLAPGATVVEALPAFADVLRSRQTRIEGLRPHVFVCGDDAHGKEVVARLMAECDCEPIDAGPLRAARYVEPAMMLLVHLAYGQGMGARVGLRLLHEAPAKREAAM